MIKPGTIFYGIKPEMVLVDSIVQSVFNENGYGCVRTSIVGKKHGKYSLHPIGYAIDYRSKHIPKISTKEHILEELKKALPCCDVILEHIGEDNEHFHIEHDNKDDLKFQADKKIYRETGVWP